MTCRVAITDQDRRVYCSKPNGHDRETPGIWIPSLQDQECRFELNSDERVKRMEVSEWG
jgi:hypothetical protein